MTNDKMLELLSIYIDLTDKQNETISQLSEVVRKQATEIAHLRNLLNVVSEQPVKRE